VLEPLTSKPQGDVLLEDLGNIIVPATGVLCSGILDGTVNPESLNYISDGVKLRTTKVLINPIVLRRAGLVCKDQRNRRLRGRVPRL